MIFPAFIYSYHNFKSNRYSWNPEVYFCAATYLYSLVSPALLTPAHSCILPTHSHSSLSRPVQSLIISILFPGIPSSCYTFICFFWQRFGLLSRMFYDLRLASPILSLVFSLWSCKSISTEPSLHNC